MIKIAILRPQALRALPRITNTEITFACSTSLGSGSAQLFTDDDRDNGLDILQLAYMDHTMGMVIMLPRVKTNTWQATNSWRPRNLLAATPLICSTQEYVGQSILYV